MKLKGAMFKLIRALKTVFVGAKIFFQSLLSLPITYENYKYIARNILVFNNLIFHACSHERVYIINVFNDFLKGNVRNPYLFPVNLRDIHPNRRGLGILARAYISRIHSKFFDPFSFN